MTAMAHNVQPLDLDAFEALALRRRTIRNFRPDAALPAGLLDRLLNVAHWAPSGYNLQPTHFFVVETEAAKRRLHLAAMKQRQVLQAPATVVFAGDREVYERDFAQIIEAEKAGGALPPQYEAALQKFVHLAFHCGPAGLSWLWKAGASAAAPLVRKATAMPQIPAVFKRAWLAKQVSLAAMNFMLAATSAGLSTVPMEGFDESRVRKACGIPRRFAVFLVVPVGYAADGPPPKKTRLDVRSRIHRVED